MEKYRDDISIRLEGSSENAGVPSEEYEKEFESSLTNGNGVLSKIKYYSDKLDSLGIETRGIDRVKPEERAENLTTQFIQVIGLWTAACGGLTSMSSFFLGSILFGLDLKNSLVSGIISMGLGCAIAGYCSTMGPRSGCRQMVGARFLFGWWFVKFIALISIIGGLGWSVVNCVVGGQVLSAISNGSVPLAVGIVIISIVSLIIAVFGIKILMKFQTLFAVPFIIATILLYICVGEKYKYIHTVDVGNNGTIRGNWLSFFSLCYSVTATWGSGASDFYILFPDTVPHYQIFLLTFFGIFFPTVFVAVIGILIGNIAYNYQPWNAAYEVYGIGGLINEAMLPWGNFGKFIVVILYLSLVSNNIMNTYSCAFDIQLADVSLAKIPRWFWAIIVTIIFLVCSLAGKDHLSDILNNFLPMLGYWISMYFVILLEENVLFRSSFTKKLHEKEFGDLDQVDEKTDHYTYNWTKWNEKSNLTHGLAAAFAFLIGISGAVIGMNQAYYKGPLASKIGEDGGDIGMWLSMAFSGLSYPLLRFIELKRFKK